VRTWENRSRFCGRVRTVRTRVRTTPDLSGCNYILVFKAFCGFWHVCEGRSHADMARLCVSPPRGQRGTNICNVCELVTLVVVLLCFGGCTPPN